MARSIYTLAAVVAIFSAIASAVQPIEVQGSDFVNSVSKAGFQIIGVDYQPGGSSGYNPGSGIDPLSNATECLRDAALMQRLGVNTLRVYNLDPSINHDQCASLFNAVGIYMILDVNAPTPGESLNRGDPASSYDSDYLTRIFGVVEAFKNYPNTLGFFSGNEVINEQSTEAVPSYIRAVTRDLKDYISKHSNRTIPVGYSAADVRDVLGDTWAYLGCNEANASSSKIDFFGLNSYSWCGNSSFTTSGYDQLVAQFSNSTIPVFFSEYGCNKVTPRVFTEVPVLYGPQMTSTFSGGLIYEYSQEVSNFGLVSLNDNGTASLLADYNNLQAQYAMLNVTLLESGNATATSLQAPACDPSLITGDFSTDFSIPSVPSGAQSLIDNGISNPNNGKLVSIASTNVLGIVYDASGNPITGLAIKELPNDQSNIPGSNTSGASSSGTSSDSGSGSSSTSAAPSATASKKGAASRSFNANSVLLAMAVLGGLLTRI